MFLNKSQKLKKFPIEPQRYKAALVIWTSRQNWNRCSPSLDNTKVRHPRAQHATVGVAKCGKSSKYLT